MFIWPAASGDASVGRCERCGKDTSNRDKKFRRVGERHVRLHTLNTYMQVKTFYNHNNIYLRLGQNTVSGTTFQ